MKMFKLILSIALVVIDVASLVLLIRNLREEKEFAEKELLPEE